VEHETEQNNKARRGVSFVNMLDIGQSEFLDALSHSSIPHVLCTNPAHPPIAKALSIFTGCSIDIRKYRVVVDDGRGVI
jgi:hypothetical protein